MVEFVEIVANAAVLVFVVTCMAAAGLGLTVRDIAAPLRRVRLAALSLAANFLIAPAIAVAFSELFQLDRPYAFGLILLGSAAGAPFLPKLAQLAKGDIAFSVGLMLLLTAGTVIFLPLALPILVPGQSVNTWPILRSLLFTMLLPLAIGIAIRGRYASWALRLRPAVTLASNVSMLIAVVLQIGIHFQAMIAAFGSGAAVVAALFVISLLAAGYMLGGPLRTTRSVLALGTGQRNIAAALIVASQNSDDSAVVVMLLISTLAGLLVLLPAARLFARLHRANGEGPAALLSEPIQAGAAR